MRKIRKKAGRPKKEKMVMGIAWYRREQWPRLREISTDRNKLEDTYDEWLANVSKAFDLLRSQGVNPARVDIDTEELLEWCRNQHLPVNAGSRSRFTLEKVQRGREHVLR